MPIHARTRTLVGVLFYAALAAFLLRYLRGVDWQQLTHLEFRVGLLILAAPFALATRLMQPLAWGTLIRGYGDKLPSYPELTLVYAKSWLGRYVPGKVAWVGGKVLFGSKYGIRSVVLAATSVIEAGIQTITALALALLLFAVTGATAALGAGMRAIALAAFVVVTIALLPPVFNRIVALAYTKLLRRPAPPPDVRVTYSTLATSILLYLVIHALSAPPLYLLIKAVYAPFPLVDLPYVTAAFLLAGTVGTLALFAPSGLGVREGVLLVLLGIRMPSEVTIIVVVFLRIWSIALDLLYYGLAEVLVRACPRLDAEPSSIR